MPPRHGPARVVVYPAEGKNSRGVTTGHVYIDGSDDRYEVAGGPPNPGPIEPGGHRPSVTPAGQYVLDRPEHHTTQNWPRSVVPFGAKLRERDLVVEYELGGHWKLASGPSGAVTRALLTWYHKSGRHLTPAVAGRLAREMFYDSDGKLMATWQQNDFGKWSWNLKRNGVRTVYFIHTTPDDEEATAQSLPFELSQSHGCLHIRPRDRDEMVRKRYLIQGTMVEVKKYNERRPYP
jgi:hypothetical protein